MKRHPRLILALKIAAALAVLVYLLRLVEWPNVVGSARAADTRLLVVALVLMPLNLLLEVWLWHRLSVQGGGEPTVSDSVASVLCGHSAGIITPARSGEVVVRAMYAGQTDTWRAGALALIHRMLDFHAVVLVSLPACVAFFLGFAPQPPLPWGALCAAAFVLLIVLTAVLAQPRLLLRLATRVLRGERWSDRLAFLAEWPASDRVFLLILAVVRYGVYVTQYAVLLHAFGAEVPWIHALTAGAIVFFGKLLIPPVTFTDVGIREGVSVYVAGFFGIAGAVAFNAAFGLFLINLVIPSVVGVPFLLRSGGVRGATRLAPRGPEAGP
ncbi:MAG TPA: lysylphosphatidylglycerol synthase transmembrane domain-containing protein [Rhodothermales bacterium]